MRFYTGFHEKQSTRKSMGGSETDSIKSLSQLRAQIEALAKQKKTIKTQLDTIEQAAIHFMRANKKRYIDESGTGVGPYWTLVKDTREGGWKDERYHEFFTKVLSDQQQGKRWTPEELTALAKVYLKTFEKRDLKIEKHTTIRQRGTDDLEEWILTGK